MKWQVFYFEPSEKNNEDAQFAENTKCVILTIIQWIAALIFLFGSWFTVPE